MRFDRLLAAVLTVALLLETWLGGNAEGTGSRCHRRRRDDCGCRVPPQIPGGRRHRLGALFGRAADVLALGRGDLRDRVDLQHVRVRGVDANAGVRVGLAVYAGSALTLAVLPLGPNGGGEHGLKHTVPFIVVSSVVMLVVRRVVGDRERRARMAERERDLVAREAVVEERARIARELHDVIAHNVSMMVVQAGAERRVLDESRPRRGRCSRRSSRSAAEH